MYHTIPASFFGESAVATFIVSPEHQVLFWNKACEKLTGLHCSQLLATRSHWRAFYEENRPCLVDIVIAGNYEDLSRLYEKFGKSKLSPEGMSAEGWYDNLDGQRKYIIFDAAPIYNANGELIAAIETLQDITEMKSHDLENERLIQDLKKASPDCPPLKGFIPICSSCKDIRVKNGEWMAVADYFSQKTEVLFSHGICPKCAQKLYPEYYNKIFK